MSFSSEVKQELCRVPLSRKCCAQAECYGVLLYCNTFSPREIRVITESDPFAQRLPQLLRRAFRFSFDRLPDGEGKHIFAVEDPRKLSAVQQLLGGDDRAPALHINFGVLEEPCCRAAFLRGAFLAGGSVTDPRKGYHLELATSHHSVAKECYILIHETLGFTPKLATRSGTQVIYLKQNEQISDFLTFLGASVASMGIIEARLEHELNNQVNRRCNCDDANITKVVEASREQMNAIRTLREQNRFDALPDKLKQAALVREENPESSLAELASLVEPQISKPAMSHRLKRLVELAEEGSI